MEIVLVDDKILFVSGFVFLTIESIDLNLRLLYTPSANIYSETLNHSSNGSSSLSLRILRRDNDEEFDAILSRVEDLIDRIKDVKYQYEYDFLHEDNSEYFSDKFTGIVDCFNEGLNLDSKTQNKFEIRILDIVLDMDYIGIKPFGENLLIPNKKKIEF